MKVGFFNSTLDLSVRSYIDHVVVELETLGVEMLPFVAREEPPAEADLYWDPRLTGGTPPWRALKGLSKPVVVTTHDGGALFAIRPWECYASTRQAARGMWDSLRRFAYWQRWKGECAAIITVSEFAGGEVRRNLRLGGEHIVPIHHGVDHELFSPEQGEAEEGSPYFLHVSAYHPVKNLRRLVEAFGLLEAEPKPRLVIVAPRCPEDFGAAPGVEIRREALSHDELAPLYRRALAFLFPSFYETFGMPILEAMACGCPVITSRKAGCAEVAGEAALLVNPRSTEELRRAMELVATSAETRRSLRQKALERSAAFSWRQTAERHLAVFEGALAGGVP